MQRVNLEKSRIPIFYATGAFLITVAVIVDITYDPVNLPKLILLSAFGFGAFFISQRLNQFSKFKNDKISFLILVIPFWMLISTIVSDSPFELSFWGEYGRNTGLLAYLSLALFFLAITNYKSKELLRPMLLAFFLSGLVNTLYGNLAFFSGKDPIPWSNPFAPAILGTFGNPNFIGSFMGIFGGFIFGYLLFCKLSPKLLMGGIFLEISIVTSIYAARATQGYLVFGLTAAFIFYFWLRTRFKWPNVANFYAIGLSAVAVVVALGVFNLGPLSSILHKDSITYRGQYWAAGINMANSSPVFGLGPDSYGTWYRTFRDPSALISPGVDVTTNAAHNVLIDFLVNGGYPLMVFYMFFIIFVLVKAIRKLLISKEVDFFLLSFTTIWIGYLAQSIVSINQLGLAIWGWIAPACILLSLRENFPDGKINARKLKENKKDSQSVVVYALIGLFLGGSVSSPMLIVEKNWRNALEIGNLPKIEQTINAFPRSTNRFILGIKILSNNNLDKEALKYVRELNEFDPNSFVGWDYLLNVRAANEQDKIKALGELKRLDPNRKFE